MVVAEDTSSPVDYSVQEERKEVTKPRPTAYEEFQRLLKIIRMKGLTVSESQLQVAMYTGCDLFFNEGVVVMAEE